MSAARELGYVPNEAARMMVTRRTHAVGIVVADLASAVYPIIMESLQSRLLQHGYRMILIRDPDASPDPQAVDTLGKTTVDGMILLSARDKSTALSRVLDRQTPVVLLSRDDVSVDVEAVLADDISAGEQAISHLQDLGHTEIGVISTLRDRSNGRDREDGAREAMGRLNIPVRQDWLQRIRLTHEDGVRVARRLLDQEGRPTALFCVNDVFALAALDAASQLGLRVPDDLSIVGVDDSPPARWSFINLTTVHQPIADMAKDAVDRLIRRIDGGLPNQPSKAIHPVRLEVRGTTAPPPQAVLRPPLRSRV
ncbi:LacI family transcriptional regulator [Citricoccus sp. K5]|nr:LacI family transcriptional regulator [Citricoccus sp. K5]